MWILHFLFLASIGTCSGVPALLRELVLPFFGQDAIHVYSEAVKMTLSAQYGKCDKQTIGKIMFPFAQQCVSRVENFEEKMKILDIKDVSSIFINAGCFLRIINLGKVRTPPDTLGIKGNRLEELGMVIKSLLLQIDDMPNSFLESLKNMLALCCRIQILEKPESLLAYAKTLPTVLIPSARLDDTRDHPFKNDVVGLEGSDEMKWARSLLGLRRLDIHFSKLSIDLGLVIFLNWSSQSDGSPYLRVLQLHRYLHLMRRMGKGGIDGLERKLNAFMLQFLEEQGDNTIMQDEIIKRLQYKQMPRESIALERPRSIPLLPRSLVNAINRHVSKKNRKYLASLLQPIWSFVNLNNPSDPEFITAQYQSAMDYFPAQQIEDEDERLVRDLMQVNYYIAHVYHQHELHTKPWAFHAPAGDDKIKYMRQLAAWMNTFDAELKRKNGGVGLKDTWINKIIVNECKAVFLQDAEECMWLTFNLLHPSITSSMFTQIIS